MEELTIVGPRTGRIPLHEVGLVHETRLAAAIRNNLRLAVLVADNSGCGIR